MQVVEVALEEGQIKSLEKGEDSRDYPLQAGGKPAPESVRAEWDRWKLQRLRLRKCRRSMGAYVCEQAKLQVDQGIAAADTQLRRLRIAGQ